MTRARQTYAGPQRWISVGIVIQGIASVPGLAAMSLIAVTMVQSGRGMETYRSVWLVEDSWIGLLVFVGCAIAALALGAAFRLRDYLEQRSFEKKFEDRSKNG
jgi:hypothetical protein